jgi:hypothetical protein
MPERDYKKEYAEYHGKPEQRQRRSSRVLARRLMEKRLGKAATNGKDVDHKDGNPMNNSSSNLRMTSKSFNRSRK